MKSYIDPGARLRAVEDRLGGIDDEGQGCIAKDERGDAIVLNRYAGDRWVGVVSDSIDLGGECPDDFGPFNGRERVQARYQRVEFRLLTIRESGESL